MTLGSGALPFDFTWAELALINWSDDSRGGLLMRSLPSLSFPPIVLSLSLSLSHWESIDYSRSHYCGQWGFCTRFFPSAPVPTLKMKQAKHFRKSNSNNAQPKSDLGFQDFLLLFLPVARSLLLGNKLVGWMNQWMDEELAVTFVSPWDFQIDIWCLRSPLSFSYDSRMFGKDEIEEIRRISLADVILNSTSITPQEIQSKVFFWIPGNPCPQPMQLNSTVLDPCKYLTGFDYFEVSYNFFWKWTFMKTLRDFTKLSFLVDFEYYLKAFYEIQFFLTGFETISVFLKAFFWRYFMKLRVF